MKYVALSFIMLMGSFAQAQVACSDVLRDSGVQISNKDFTAALQNDPTKVPELTLRLLRMSSFTKEQSFSEKGTVEKGELFLAEELADGWTIEYDYIRDRRGPKDVFRLTKVSVVNPKGVKKALEGSPLSADGLKLSKSRWSEADLGMEKLGEKSPTDSLRTLQAPAVIQGALLESLLEWAPRMQFLTRHDLRSKIDTDQRAHSIYSLRSRATLRSSTDFGAQIIKKQTFKLLLMAFAMYVYAQEKDTIQGWISTFQDPWGAIVEQTDLAGLRAVFAGVNIGGVASATKVTAEIDVLRALKDVHTLLLKEKELGAVPRNYTFSNGKFKVLAPKRVVKSIQQVAEAEGDTIIIIYPASKRALILQGSDEDPTKVKLFGVDTERHPGVFETINALSQVSQNK